MRALLTLALALAACSGGEPAEDPAEPAATTGRESEAPPPPPRARVLARYGCEETGWTLTYTIDAHERGCADGSTTAPLVIVQRAGDDDGPQRFSFTLGTDAGEGPICRAPASCPDADNTVEIFDGDPPRVEWSLSLANEGVEHGSGAVLLCNEGPPAPCEL